MKKTNILKGLSLISLSMLGSFGFSQTFTFTNCEATGQNGPDGAAVTAGYVGCVDDTDPDAILTSEPNINNKYKFS